MVAKPLCPLYKNIIKPLDRARYPELRYVLTYPLNPTTSVIQVKQGSQRYSLYFSQEGGLLHEKNISNGDDTNWPPTE